MKSKALSRLKQISDDQSGQMTLLFLFIVILILALVMLNFNSGKVIQDKLKTQNAADASSLSGGAWMARCLNHVSMNNVAMTHTLAWILILRGIKKTVDTTQPIAEGMKIACCGSSASGVLAIFTGLCCAGATVADWWASTFKELTDTKFYSDLISEKETISLWKLMKALEYMNRLIINTYPLLAEADTYWLATKNKADFAVLLPYPGFDLPVKTGQFSDLCDPTWKGSPSNAKLDSIRGYHPLLDYKLDQGPLKKKMDDIKHIFWPMLIVGGPLTFTKITEAGFGAVCKNCDVSDEYEVEQTTTSYQEAKNRTADVSSSCWIYAEATRGPTLVKTLSLGERLLEDPRYRRGELADQRLEPGAEFDCRDYDCENYPASDPSANAITKVVRGLNVSSDLTAGGFDRLNQNTWNRCVTEETENNSETGKIMCTHRIEQYHFVFARFAGKKKKEDDPTEGFADEKLAKPTLLTNRDPEVLKDLLSYLVVAYKRKSELPFEKLYSNPNPVATLAYSQVLVHNPTSIDLFTQDWHVKLVPADRFERFFDRISETIDKLPEEGRNSMLPASGDFSEITGVLKSGLEYLNHH